MGTPRFTPEFKEEAVRQITERGYSVAEGTLGRKGCRSQNPLNYIASSLSTICPGALPANYSYSYPASEGPQTHVFPR